MPPPKSLPTRRLGKDGPQISAIGFGLMGMSTAYGTPGTDEERFQVLDRAWELGCTNWDTADFYGDSEDLLGKWFRLHPERRADIFLASKFGLSFGLPPDARPGQAPGVLINSTPAYCRASCEESLHRLGLSYIDLYYVHRVDGVTPIEATMAELASLQREGKIRHIGLSSPSSATLRRAYAVAPVAAVQVEYSVFSRDIEGPAGTDLLRTCRALGVTTFAYAPIGRGLLTGQIRATTDIDGGAHDLRRMVPRLSGANLDKNLELVDAIAALAAAKTCTPGQLALAWLLAQGDDVVPIPGTKRVAYLEENVGAAHVQLTDAEVADIRRLVDDKGVAGEPMTAGVLKDYGDTPPLQV
ncbi:Aldo/keto reductase-like protein [Niveomyces insectorum RCEF 264]|uniref:Aldo/keto reductase-like protein n=1 Tax=Niveomyces insectorum RCEF 264 TaxID=1081102 RepID=A0A167VPF8_9HYPO|nr:Aldo/keto reductase-like protein [Niveomyces insectorum RCEF 264]